MFCAILMLAWSKGVYCSFGLRANYSKRHHVDLSNRHLTEIPLNIPIDTERLDLSHNEIQNIPNDIFTNLSNIRTLDMSFNKINEIFVNSFNGLSRIESLNLARNQLTHESLQNESFKHISFLKILQIQANPDDGTSSISYSDELYRLRLLHTLHLDGIDTEPNQLYKFECFKNLKNLTIKSLISVKNTTFKSFQNLPLEELAILQIENVQKNAFAFFPKLQKLNLRVKWGTLNFENIFPALEVFNGRRMTSISLTHNSHSHSFILGQSHLQYIWNICLKELYLPSNNIEDIDALSFKEFAQKSTCLEVFDMSNNPVETENFFWYMYFPFFKNLKVIRLSYIGFRPSSEILVKKSMQCTWGLKFPSTLQELSINFGFTRYGWPNLTVTDGQSLKILNLCQMKFQNCLGSFVGLPNLTLLDISGFNCTYLNPDILQLLPRLEILTAQNINLNLGLKLLRESGAHIFLNLINLRYVDLSMNNLENFPSDIFKEQQETLNHLKLGSNAFRNIPISINKFKLLKLLDLSYNSIEYLEEGDRELLDKNTDADILFSGNPIQCTCDHIKFLRWIKDRGMKYFVNVECIGEDRIRQNISEVIRSLKSFELNCVVTFWLYFSIVMSFLSLALVLFLSIYYQYRSEIQYFFLKLRINMKRYKALEECCEYKFDAFISYSSSDTPWVAKFYRQLRDNGFNICIDFVQFTPGEGIAENIVKAIDSCRKIIFIVTRNFLKSSWGGYEIEMTRMHAFREGRENMVIIIIMDEIPIDEMPRTLKQMWNKIVCLKYNDEDETIFYDTLAVCLR